jgi:adenylate cyclase
LTSERVERRLAAVLAADVVGYSRLMGIDEVGTLATLKALRRELIDPTIAEHNGRIVKTTGDGLLVVFSSAVDAVSCAMQVQMKMAASVSDNSQQILLRIGINVGDIIVDGDDIFGDGVNVASRIESECEPGSVYLSGNAFEQIRGKVSFAFDDVGEKSLKNIDRPVRLYAVKPRPSSAAKSSIDQGKPLPLPDKPSIAVLPFQNMSSDAEQEYFADGIVEEIITALSRFRQLFVIARNSSFTYKGRAVDVKQVGRELGVQYVLEGSVRKAGDRLRITGQLIDASTGSHLWADRFDGALKDIFDLQDKITLNVIGAIEPRLREAEIERARNKRPENLDAYDCVMRAMPAFWSADAEARKEALIFLERAIAIDPRYALAKALAAWCHAQNLAYHGTPELLQERSEAIRLAEEAVRLDSEDPMVLTALGAAYSIARRAAQASPLIEKALILNPNSAWTWQRSGWLKLYLGQFDTAIEHFDRSIRISPLDVLNFNAFFGIGCSHFGAFRYENAIAWFEKALSARPSAVFVYRVLASALAHLGRLDEARQAVATFRSRFPDVTISRIVETLPMNPQEYVDRFCEGIRKAGLPE